MAVEVESLINSLEAINNEKQIFFFKASLYFECVM